MINLGSFAFSAKKVTVKPCACLFSILYRECKCFFLILQHTHLSSKTKQPDFGNYFGHDSLIVFSNSLLGIFKNHLSQNANTRSVFFSHSTIYLFLWHQGHIRTHWQCFYLVTFFFTDSCSRSVNAPYYLYLFVNREKCHILKITYQQDLIRLHVGLSRNDLL